MTMTFATVLLIFEAGMFVALLVVHVSQRRIRRQVDTAIEKSRKEAA